MAGSSTIESNRLCAEQIYFTDAVCVPGMVGRSEICHHSVAAANTTHMTMPYLVHFEDFIKIY